MQTASILHDKSGTHFLDETRAVSTLHAKTLGNPRSFCIVLFWVLINLFL